MIKTDNEDVNYVAECAEAVGIEINDETAFSFNLIAKVMRKMRESNEDCISRQAVLAIAGDSCLDLDSYEDTKEFCDEIKELPPVTPKPKTGHWVEGKYKDDDIRYNDSSYKCDKCGKVVDFKENYCPNCQSIMLPTDSKSEDKK